jgi:hypothetical protein
VEQDALFTSVPETRSALYCVAVSVLTDGVKSERHTCDLCSKFDVASCRRVFPDSVLLGARRNLSLTCLKLKLGVEIALWSAVFIFRLFPSASEDVAVG